MCFVYIVMYALKFQFINTHFHDNPCEILRSQLLKKSGKQENFSLALRHKNRTSNAEESFRVLEDLFNCHHRLIVKVSFSNKKLLFCSFLRCDLKFSPLDFVVLGA